MELRKVQEMGGGTHLVSLPKAWVRRNKITKGATINIEETSDGRLLMSPFGASPNPTKEVKIPYPSEYSELLINEVTGAYLLGYDLILLQGKDKISYHDRELVKRTVRQLVGLEIVEEDSKSMAVQFLLEPSTLEPEKIFRRVHMIARGMYVDAITALLDKEKDIVRPIVHRDEEVNRLYFLLVRLIRSAVLDSSLASRYRLTPIECLDYRVASNILETVGDYSVEFAKNAQKMSEIGATVGLESQFKIIRESLQGSQDLAVKSFLTRNTADAREVVKLYREITETVRDLERMMGQQSPSAVHATIATASSIDKIARCQVDIADLVAPVYPIVR